MGYFLQHCCPLDLHFFNGGGIQLPVSASIEQESC